MSAGTYYRDPLNVNDVVGPLTPEQFELGVAAGDIERHFEVSCDRDKWQTAEDVFPDLFGATARGPAGTSNASNAQHFAEWVFQRLRRAFLAAWDYLRTVGIYYWSHRVALRKLFTEYATWFQPAGNRKEIRIHADDNLVSVTFDGEKWDVELPDCCVICGKETGCDWNIEQRSVPNLIWPLWGPLGGLILGLLFGLAYWNRWLVPPFALIGTALGYHRRGETLVKVRFRRCRKHLNKTDLPDFRVIADGLVIGVGNRSVWRQFHYGKSALDMPAPVPSDPGQPQTSAWSGSPNMEGDRKELPSIPLAGDPDRIEIDPDVDLETDFPDLEIIESDEDVLESDETDQVQREND